MMMHPMDRWRDKEPRQRYALVMMDELDAHMHPQWQNGIVKRLKSFFPGEYDKCSHITFFLLASSNLSLRAVCLVRAIGCRCEAIQE